MIEFLTKGFLTTVQDNGRPAFQRFGVSVAGAMDKFSLSLANILVGNKPTREALEITILGPTIRIHTANVFAICGGDFSAMLDGVPIENNRAYLAPAGSKLTLGTVQRGCRAYLAFAGGFDIEKVMGSRSTYMKGSLGCFDGRPIAVGDKLGFAAPNPNLTGMEYRFLGCSFGLPTSSPQPLRVIAGPQIDYFSKEGVDTFVSSEYIVTDKFDRMGYRLNGASIAHAEGKDGNIISDGVPLGAIQVPQDQPIIMMADRQTTGGYTKIASVVSVDLPYVAQLKAGDAVRFQMIDIIEAQRLYIERMQFFRKLNDQLNQTTIIGKHIYQITAAGKTFHLECSEIVDS